MGLSDPANAGFWDSIYDNGHPPWDQDEAAPPLVRAVDALIVPAGARVFVPGCGLGHDALFLAAQGYTVTALDFAASAVAGLRLRAAKAGLCLDVVQADLFALPTAMDDSFDLLVEHTCFCAVPLDRRADYVQVAARVLRPGASLLGLFFEVDAALEDGPPFATTQADVEHHFEPLFDIQNLEQPPDSFARRRGREWLGHMVRR
ncbi:MAG: methyltransferase domain-containing protein [bacterium]|nr:methyltransferase domain-containing protein [bacterium]